MAGNMKFAAAVGMLVVLMMLSSVHPMPQDRVVSTATTGKPAKATTSATDASDTPTTTESSTQGPLGGFMEGLFGFLGNVFDTVKKIADDPAASKTVGRIIEVGVNATGAVIRAGADIFSEGPEKAADRSTNLVRGAVKVANETRPLVKKRLTELQSVGKLLGSFIQSFSETMLDNVEEFMKTYDRRLKCHSKCETLESKEERMQCEKDNCEGFNAEDFRFADADKSGDSKKKSGISGFSLASSVAATDKSVDYGDVPTIV